MSYRQIKKLHKQKKTSLVPPDLISGNRFDEIVTLLRDKTELTHNDRYLYGYSLLRTQQELASLITLWPLAAKGNTKLHEDCVSIAAHVFQDVRSLAAIQLSEEALYTLLLVARSLFPNSQVYSDLLQRYCNTLWQLGHYEKLEKILKSSKDNFSGILVENLSKLAFFQHINKLAVNTPAFISHILTGGACLIARNPIYHGGAADAMQLLANEIKQLFSRLADKNQKLALDRFVFESFIDYEAGILTEVLQLATRNGESQLDIIPSPGYLMSFDSTNRRMSEKFLPWLATESKELYDLYSVPTQQAVLFALGIKELSAINSLLPLDENTQLHPHLRLALMFRTVHSKKPIFNLVHIGEFDTLNADLLPLKNLLLDTIQSVINQVSILSLKQEFWQMLQEFYPVIACPELKNRLIVHSIYELKQQRKQQKTINFSEINRIAILVNDDELTKQVNALRVRQQACSEFLLTISSKAKSKKCISTLKNAPTLLTHLSLIADSCFLNYSELSTNFWEHFKSLVHNKKINTLLPLSDLSNHDFACQCSSCQEVLYECEIPMIARELNVSIMRFPDESLYFSSNETSSSHKLLPSILSQTNPFKTLDASLTDSKQAIMQKMMHLIKQSPEQMVLLRQAQNELFNPVHRFLHHYFHYLAYEEKPITDNKANPSSSPLNLRLYKIPFRSELLNAK